LRVAHTGLVREIGPLGGVGLAGARTALGQIPGPLLFELLDELRLGWHGFARAKSAEAAPPRRLQRLEAVDAVAEAPWHCNDLTLDHGCIIGQEEDQLATCHASDPTRSKHGSNEQGRAARQGCQQ
jgi:hypothetical protein